MFDVVLSNMTDQPWIGMPPLFIGKASSGISTPECFGLVSLNGDPCLRIDIHGKWRGPFTQALPWASFVVIGWGDDVHLIDPLERRCQTIQCDGYFGHLYPADNRLLIATAAELICIGENGDLIWKRSDLASDGVVVDSIEAGVIVGQGEWDPPGGWRPFQLLMSTGAST